MPLSISGITRGMNRRTANSRIGQRVLRTLPVPADLGAVTDVGRIGELAPESVGMRQDDVGAIWSCAEDLYCTGYYPALMLCIRRHGKIVLNRAIGHARGFGEPGGPDIPEPVSTGTPACLYSASKAITAILIHKLADDGHVNLLDPVAHYLPEFAKHGKDRLTILQILSHRGGVPGIRCEISLEKLVHHETLLKLVCEAEPTDVHGRKQAYHAITGGTILQAILERVTGHSIRSYWHDNFKKPMQFRMALT